MQSKARRLAAAILAGGKATRYGGMPKGLLPLPDGATMMDKALAAVRAIEPEETIISANDPALYSRFGLTVVQDLRSGAGPLGGIEAALAYFAGRDVGVIFLPCDMPGACGEMVARLAEAYDPLNAPLVAARRGAFFWEPLCAIAHNALLPKVSAALDAGQRGVCELWLELGAAAVNFDDASIFHNINAPADMAAWRGSEVPECGGRSDCS